MKIRRATQSDFQDIAAIHIESWKNSYSDILPVEFLAGQIDRDIERHWSGIEIQNEDIVLVAEENSLIGFVAVWCRPNPFRLLRENRTQGSVRGRSGNWPVYLDDTHKR
jgi:hypothetical protein